MTVSKLHELEQQLKELQAAIEAERARIREEAIEEQKPIIQRLGIWNNYLGVLPARPITAPVLTEDVEFGPDGWSVESDEYSGFYYKKILAMRDMLLRSDKREDRIGARLNPTFFYSYVTIGSGTTAEQLKFVQNNYNIAQMNRPFFDMSFRWKSMPKVYLEWINGNNRWSWNKATRPTPVLESVSPIHKLVHAGNGGLERARSKFEAFWELPDGFTDAYQYGRAQTKAYDYAWANLKDDDEVKAQFLAENPWYEPEVPFVPKES